MSIHIEWGSSDHTILIWRVMTELTLEGYVAASNQTAALLKAGHNPLTIVMDMRHCQYTAHNLIPVIRDQIRALQNFHGEIIVLSKTQFWQGIYHVAARSSIGLNLPNIRFHITQNEDTDILATL